jgi:hypothetical protein
MTAFLMIVDLRIVRSVAQTTPERGPWSQERLSRIQRRRAGVQPMLERLRGEKK